MAASVAFLAAILLGQMLRAQIIELNGFPAPSRKQLVSTAQFNAHTLEDPPLLSIRGTPIGLLRIFSFFPPASQKGLKSEEKSSQRSQNAGFLAAEKDDDSQKVGLAILAPVARQESSSLPASLQDAQRNRITSESAWQMTPSASPFNMEAEGSQRIPYESFIKEKGNVKNLEVFVSGLEHSQTRSYFGFLDVQLNVLSPISAETKVQATLIRLADFKNFFVRSEPSFCCREANAAQGKCIKNSFVPPPGVSIYKTVNITREKLASDDIFEVPVTAAYILLISNCGEEPMEASISGGFVLRNYYGFLPGSEAENLSFHFLLLGLFLALSVVWACVALKNRKYLIPIQWSIFGLLAVNIFEGLLWCAYFRNWNSAGYPKPYLFALAVICSSVEGAASLVTVLVASLGWGITHHSLSVSTKQKIALILIGHTLFDSFKRIVMELKTEWGLSPWFLGTCVIPLFLIQGTVFLWILTSLDKEITILKKSDQTEKLDILNRFKCIFTSTLFLAIFLMSVELIFLSREYSDQWKHLWIFREACPKILYVMVLLVMMLYWAPSRRLKILAQADQLPMSISPGNAHGPSVRDATAASIPQMFRLHDDSTLTDVKLFRAIEMETTLGTTPNLETKAAQRGPE